MLPPLPEAMPPGTIFAHRGDRVAERENTVAAFRSAAAAGARGVELDVRRTADDQLVVHHDAVIGGLGAIFELSFAQIRTEAPWLPTLSEAIAASHGMWVNVEVKNDPDDVDFDEQRQVARGLGDHIGTQGIIVSSFDWESVVGARDAGFAAAYLVRSALASAIERAGAAGLRAVNPRGDLVAGDELAPAVSAATAVDLWLMVWTINDVAEAHRLRDGGIDVIFTDDPARMVAALG